MTRINRTVDRVPSNSTSESAGYNQPPNGGPDYQGNGNNPSDAGPNMQQNQNDQNSPVSQNGQDNQDYDQDHMERVVPFGRHGNRTEN